MKAKIVQGEKEVPTEVIADAIVAMSAGIKNLRSGRLNDKALVLLIQHACESYYINGKLINISQRDVKIVLEAIEVLEARYIKKKAPAR